MENKNRIVIEPVDNRQGFLALPFDEEQFRNFLIGLLGKPQTISRIIEGSFDISLAEIQNFHYLITQRINQQNQGQLLQFRAKIYFDDKSSVELNSFQELETYNEVRPIASTGIELSWDYLILFADKNCPEKQTINVKIYTGRQFGFSNLFSIDQRIFENREGLIEIEINHTARTWAADIESLLTNHVNSLLKTPNKFRVFINKNEGKISLLVGVLFFLMSVFGSLWATNEYLGTLLSGIGNAILSQTNLGEKINLLATNMLSGSISFQYFKVVLFLVISLFFSIVFAVVVSASIVPPEHSFLVLTKKALDKKKDVLKKDERSWIKFVFSTLLSIICGILSNYIFILLSK